MITISGRRIARLYKSQESTSSPLSLFVFLIFFLCIKVHFSINKKHLLFVLNLSKQEPSGILHDFWCQGFDTCFDSRVGFRIEYLLGRSLPLSVSHHSSKQGLYFFLNMTNHFRKCWHLHLYAKAAFYLRKSTPSAAFCRAEKLCSFFSMATCF